MILAKTESIQRCIDRIVADYVGFEEDFDLNYMRQDAIILNLQRACEQTIDLANHLIRIHALTVPKSSRDAFSTLATAGIIPTELSQATERMVSFRNIAVHEYQKMNLEIVVNIIQHHLADFHRFIALMSDQI